MSPRMFTVLMLLLGSGIAAAGAVHSGGSPVLVEVPRASLVTTALEAPRQQEPKVPPIRVILPSPYEAR
jgi:hypothetical protein